MASHVSGARTVDAVLPTFQDNLITSVNVLVAAHEVACERVVFAGSVEEPEPSPQLSLPHSPYAAAKHAAGAYGRMFHALYGLPVTTLRVAMAYGPGQGDLNKLVPHVITSLLRGEVPILSSGEREVDWVYVDDVVDAFVCAATAPGVGGLTLDVGSGRLVTVRHVVEKLFALVSPDVTPQFGGLANRALEQVCVADVEATSSQMDWRPQVGLLDGLSRTVDWYRQQRGRAWDSASS